MFGRNTASDSASWMYFHEAESPSFHVATAPAHLLTVFEKDVFSAASKEAAAVPACVGNCCIPLPARPMASLLATARDELGRRGHFSSLNGSKSASETPFPPPSRDWLFNQGLVLQQWPVQVPHFQNMDPRSPFSGLQGALYKFQAIGLVSFGLRLVQGSRLRRTHPPTRKEGLLDTSFGQRKCTESTQKRTGRDVCPFSPVKRTSRTSRWRPTVDVGEVAEDGRSGRSPAARMDKKYKAMGVLFGLLKKSRALV